MVKNFIKDNRLVILYIICSSLIEISAQFFADAKLFYTRFWITFIFYLIPITLLLFFKKAKYKKIFANLFLIAQIAIVLSTNFLYNATETTFQKEMIYQRNDAVGTLEQFNINFWLILISVAIFIFYFSYVIVDTKKKKVYEPSITSKKAFRISALSICILCTTVFCIIPLIDGINEKKETNYYYKLISKGNGTQMYGSTTNVFYELLAFGASSGINTTDLDTLEAFLYESKADTSKYNGVSKGNNLIVVLVESFDTHVLERYSKTETSILFPNITKMIDEGIYGANFRQKEKTDSSEIFSLLGSYPTEKYVNYSYQKNSYPFSLPSLFKTNAIENNITPQVYSFHQNDATFYNRDVLHKSLGFDKLYGIDEMTPYGMINSWKTKDNFSKGERNLDSLTIQTMKDVMFPKNKNFFSYWISFTMHGFYEERNNLKEQGYYTKLDQYNLFPKGSNEENYWRTYAATVMDFDKALGIMLTDLENKEILDNTTIVLMSDHNTYYNNLTEYAKKLNNKLDCEGFRLPFIIYDKKLADAFIANHESRIITKFITTTDLIPTICDILDIEIWKNFYLGSTIFNNNVQSIGYSRMYNFFFNDKLAFYSMDDLRYKSKDYKDEDLDAFIERAHIHLDKLYYMDKVYYVNYFKSHQYQKA